MISMEVMQNAQEIVHYNDSEIPILALSTTLSAYPHMRSLVHWHDDFEFLLVIGERMRYHVNDQMFTLHRGDVIFVNARQLHYSIAYEDEDCAFCVIVVHPACFSGVKVLGSRYVLPLITNRTLPMLFIGYERDENAGIASCMERIINVLSERVDGYPLDVLGCLFDLLARIYRISQQEEGMSEVEENPDTRSLQRMISYVHGHFQESLQLRDIAASAGVGRNRACEIFSSYLHETPMAFLGRYRLMMSHSLLLSANEKITDIALGCGFSSASYYAKCFLAQYGCTPRECRKRTTSYV